MGAEQPALTGPALTKRLTADLVDEGRLLLGHADGDPVMLTRCGSEVLAVGARCTHYGGPLAEGLVVGDTIRCPWHHAAFSLRTGESLRPPALNDLPCWRVEESGGRVRVAGKVERPLDGSAATCAHGEARRTPSTPRPASVVIVGAGAAGVVAAETLRREGYGGRVTIVDHDPDAPVDR